jgi:hypothetical protein
MFLNGDEFRVFRDGLYDDVNDFLDNVRSGAVQISWLLFGTAIKPLFAMSRAVHVCDGYYGMPVIDSLRSDVETLGLVVVG